MEILVGEMVEIIVRDPNQQLLPVGPQPGRQDDEWSVPPTVDGRDDVGR